MLAEFVQMDSASAKATFIRRSIKIREHGDNFVPPELQLIQAIISKWENLISLSKHPKTKNCKCCVSLIGIYLVTVKICIENTQFVLN